LFDADDAAMSDNAAYADARVLCHASPAKDKEMPRVRLRAMMPAAYAR